MENGPADRWLVILTAIDIEYDAVRARLADRAIRRHRAGTIFETGTVAGTPWRVALAVTGPGNLSAGVLAERAIAEFDPEALFFVGIAGSLREDVALGDVVVATRVFAYHGGRDDSCGFHPRPRSWEAAHSLEQVAWQAARVHPGPPAVHFKPVAAGEVVLNSESSPLARQLRGSYSDAVAVEMESAGAAAAAHLNDALPMLTVRGISDSVHTRKEETAGAGWPAVAADRAAAFAREVIARMPAQRPSAPRHEPRPAHGPRPPEAGAPPAVQHNRAGKGGIVFGVQGGNQYVYGDPDHRD